MGKIITYGNNCRNSVLEGIIDLENAVTITLGPKGSLVILDKGTIHPVATKDGVSVAKEISFSDKYKQIGACIIQEVARKVNQITGDGSTTTVLISAELCKAGNSLVSLGFDATDIKKGFEKARDDVIQALDNQKIVLDSEEDILHVATISANNDEDLGSVVKEAYVGIGEGGIVNLFPSNVRHGKDVVKFSTGLEILRGFIHSSMTNTNNETCEFASPKFFFYGKNLKSFDEVEPLFRLCKNVVLVSVGYSDEFMSTFIKNCENGNLSACAIMAEGETYESKIDNLLDYAAMTGGTLIDGPSKVKLDNFDPTKHLGSADEVVITVKNTVISGSKGTEEQINNRINEIKAKMAKSDGVDEMNDYELTLSKERIAKLSGGIATIYYAAPSDLELREKKDRYEDSINAVASAIEDGIIIGGGSGLLHAIKEVSSNHKPLNNATQEKGYQEFLKVMEMPARRIISSTGKDPGYYVELIKESNKKYYGYNAKTEEFSKDLYNDGVIEPVKTLKTALIYCTSVAGTFITTNCVVTSDLDNIKIVANDKVIDENREFGGFGI